MNRANINTQQQINLTSQPPTLLAYFNVDGCYLHALRPLRVGDKNFYAGMKETASPNKEASTCNPTDSAKMASNNTMDCDTTGDQTTNNSSYDEGE